MWERERLLCLNVGLANGEGGVIDSTRRERAVGGGGAQGVLPPAEVGRVLGQHRLQGREVYDGTRVLSEMKKKTRVSLSVLVRYREGEMSPENRACMLLTKVNTFEKRQVLETGASSTR